MSVLFIYLLAHRLRKRIHLGVCFVLGEEKMAGCCSLSFFYKTEAVFYVLFQMVLYTHVEYAV